MRPLFIRKSKKRLDKKVLPLHRGLFWLLAGLILLLISSRVLVWGAVEIAKGFGVSDLLIGLTIVAVGTSLPELTSAIIAARKKNALVLGNVIGSNLFNTLMVVGIAGLIRPMAVPPEILSRDLPVMAFLTLLLFLVSHGGKKAGHIGRTKGSLLLISYIGYLSYLIYVSI